VDKISIRDLRVQTRIGVTDEERAVPRAVLICIDIWADLLPAGESDELGDTVDYHTATVDIAEMVRSTEAKLLEHLAHTVASHVATLPRVTRVSVEVTKELPPMDEDVRAVSVRIEREAR
jgi:dihydroneopterin aldolase